MNIIITTDLYTPQINGVVTSVLNLKDELEKNGHNVLVITLAQSHETKITNDVIYLGSVSANLVYPKARFRLSVRNKWFKKVVDFKPDIIHSQCELSTFVVAKKIKRYFNIPLVHTYHTVYEDYTHYFSPAKKFGKSAVKYFTRRVSRKCNLMIVPSEKIRLLLEKYQVESPIKVIPTGIKLNEANVDNSLREKLNLTNSLILVYLGRIAKEKNIEELIEFQTKLSDKNIKLLIVGGGPNLEHLKTLVKEKHLEAQVIFTGMVNPDEVKSYYNIGDIFVSASTSETQGLTYAEALACKKVMLCRKDPVLTGLIDDKNGLMYNNFEEYQNFLNYYKTLSSDEIKAMQEASYQYSKALTKEKFGENIISAYNSLLNK